MLKKLFIFLAILLLLFMSLPTWEELAKNQTDNETVEEAIDRLIQAHDDDANAHLDTGQSLQSHKASEIIDHLARSILRDKLAHDRFQIETYFASLDGFTKTAGVFLNQIANAELDTTAVNGNSQSLYATASDANENGASPTNSPFWQTIVKFGSTTTQTAYICTGDPDIPVGWGFKVVNGTLYAMWVDNTDTEQTFEITGITLTNWNVFKVEFTGATSINFYVNGVLKKTVTANLPTGAASTFIMYRITTNTTAIRKMYVQELIYDEDFFN
jgi:hypothetical protein